MTFLENYNALYSLAGLGVGVLVGMTGVGGGSMMTPLLILLFGIHPATAVGTDLLYASTTKSVGTMVHGIAGTVDWRVVRRLAYGSIPTTILTISVLAEMGPMGKQANTLITTVLGTTLFLTSFALVFRKRILASYAACVGDLSPGKTAACTVLTGAALGILVSISSVGAGALGVTALILLYPQLPMVRIVGSDIAHAVPLTLVAGLGHWFLGSLDWLLLASLLVGSIPGIGLGAGDRGGPSVVLLMFCRPAGVLAGQTPWFCLA
jgi:uncharacterized membrane protein YfcA